MMHVIAKCKVYEDVFEINMEKTVFQKRADFKNYLPFKTPCSQQYVENITKIFLHTHTKTA